MAMRFLEILKDSAHLIGENNYSGSCALSAQRNQLRAKRHIRNTTRPFMPHHSCGGSERNNSPGRTKLSVPMHGLWSEEETRMATSVQRASQLTMADMKGKVDPDWCPGCGDFGVLACVQKALVELSIPNHSVVTISASDVPPTSPGT